MASPVSVNTPCSGQGGRNCCYIWHLILDGRFSDIRIIMLTQLTAGGIDYQLDFVVFYPIHDIWPTLVHFGNQIRFNTVPGQKLMSAISRLDFEPEFIKLLRHLKAAVLSFSDTVIRTVPSAGRVCCAPSCAL